jgi:hypothetical protein
MGFLAFGKVGLGDQGKIGLAAGELAWFTAASRERWPTVEDNEGFQNEAHAFDFRFTVCRSSQ